MYDILERKGEKEREGRMYEPVTMATFPWSREPGDECLVMLVEFGY